MEIEIKYDNNQLRDYSSLFLRNEVISWIKTDFTSINRKIERYDKKWFKLKKATYLDYLKFVYSILVKNYQNEYVYKNEYLNERLISELDENSKVFSEFRVGNSVADLVMFNGCSKIFEIKTELDTENRLPLQIETYKKAFNEIYLIVPEKKLNNYEKYDKEIGLIAFDLCENNNFTIYRNATINYEIDPITIMNILHTKEYISIVKKYYEKLPQMTSFTQFKICSDLICNIPTTELNKLFITEIKKRGENNALSNKTFIEFNQIFLALKMDKVKKNKLIELLKTPLQR